LAIKPWLIIGCGGDNAVVLRGKCYPGPGRFEPGRNLQFVIWNRFFHSLSVELRSARGSGHETRARDRSARSVRIPSDQEITLDDGATVDPVVGAIVNPVVGAVVNPVVGAVVNPVVGATEADVPVVVVEVTVN
jgi:hypothetical protein